MEEDGWWLVRTKGSHRQIKHTIQQHLLIGAIIRAVILNY
ncbi:MAG: hypothetical protein DRQ58_02355 [Gammaproteobacteria bacterium]|nr:MAG: hypothetical protein DRQ58_02355 [Gammaproteobacteria bacterium]